MPSDQPGRSVFGLIDPKPEGDSDAPECGHRFGSKSCALKPGHEGPWHTSKSGSSWPFDVPPGPDPWAVIAEAVHELGNVIPLAQMAVDKLALVGPPMPHFERLAAGMTRAIMVLAELTSALRQHEGGKPSALVPWYPDPYTIEVARQLAAHGADEARRALAELGREGPEALRLAFQRLERIKVELGSPGAGTPRVPLAGPRDAGVAPPRGELPHERPPTLHAEGGRFYLEVPEHCCGSDMSREEALALYVQLGRALAKPST